MKRQKHLLSKAVVVLNFGTNG